MHESTRELLEGVIDYAGMFPPASLSLTEALHTYRAFSATDHQWISQRFVIGVQHFATLYASIMKSPPATPIRCCVVASKTADASGTEWVDHVKRDLDFIFDPAWARDFLVVDTVEIAVPPLAVNTRSVVELMEILNLNEVDAFFEVNTLPTSGAWVDGNRRLLEQLADYRGRGPHVTGLKLRCGGTIPTVFPTSRQLARALMEAGRRAVAVKFTAGLHHPFPTHDSTVGCFMHGFVNVMTAALSAYIYPVDLDSLIAILDDVNPEHFQFRADALRREGVILDATQIKAARTEFVRSFGSCSLDEPLADLSQWAIL